MSHICEVRKVLMNKKSTGGKKRKEKKKNGGKKKKKKKKAGLVEMNRKCNQQPLKPFIHESALRIRALGFQFDFLSLARIARFFFFRFSFRFKYPV